MSFVLSASLKVSKDTFNVDIATSTGIGSSHSCISGIGLVARVKEENATLSHFLSLHRLIIAWIRTRFAELPLLTATQ
jgi:hypothetical protein